MPRQLLGVLGKPGFKTQRANPQLMNAYWKTIETWLKSNAPDALSGLNPPATEKEIAEAENALGIKFPADCVTTYRIHNGQSSDSPGIFDAWVFLSLERIVDEWKIWKDLVDNGEFKAMQSDSTGATVKDWWSPSWIPLTYDGAGNHDCLDLNPGPKGRKGQIIRMWHDESERPVVASSYGEWIALLASDMQKGRCHFSEEYNGVIRGDV